MFESCRGRTATIIGRSREALIVSRTMASEKHDVDDDGTDTEDAAEWAGTAGLIARGAMYLVSAVLTFRIATGAPTDEGPGKDGALHTLAQQPFGRVLLIVLAAGLAGYALWRFTAAATYNPDPDDSAVKSYTKRAGYVGRGLIYLAALFTALSLIFGGSDSQSSGGSGEGSSGGQTDRVFDLPLGRWIVLGVGLGVIGAAGYNFYRAVTLKYREKWDGRLDPGERRVATVVATAGLLGHMLVFALIGYFLTRAAIQHDPSEPESLDQAVRALSQTSWGPAVLLTLAAGMVAYAAFSFIEARWRRLLD